MNAIIEALSVNYADLLSEDSYIVAYNQIKSKPGNMTPGIDKESLDGIDKRWIKSTVDAMRTRQFRFRPSRRTYIPKANGQKRPLGIPSPRDKVVQKALLNILEPAYESKVFLDTSHGFRPKRSTHTAINSIRKKWQGVTWVIEGDIKSYFDTIDHDILGKLLQQRIKDQDIFEVYRKLVKAGYVEAPPRRITSEIGVPQGGILSPFLSNVYLHELDVFVAQLKKSYDSVGPISVRNRDYHNTCHRHLSAVSAFRKNGSMTKLKKIRELRNLRNRTPSVSRTGQRIHYVRYADDWLIGLQGPQSLAIEIKQKVASFLADNLKIELNIDKTKITKIAIDPVYFLGFKIMATTSISWQGYSLKGVAGEHQRKGGGDIKVYAPLENIIKELEKENLAADNKGIAHSKWVNLTDAEIIVKYRSMIMGYYNYYHIVDNPYGLHQIHYLLKYSAAHTLAMKHKTTLGKIFTKYGPDLSVNRLQLACAAEDVDKGVKSNSISLALPAHFKTSKAIIEYRLSRKAPLWEQPRDPLEVVKYRLRSRIMFNEPQVYVAPIHASRCTT